MEAEGLLAALLFRFASNQDAASWNLFGSQ